MNALSRREFLRRSAGFGAVFAGATVLPRLWAAEPAPTADQPAASGGADLGVAKGADAFQTTVEAIALLGGIGRFVKSGARVGLLINAPRWWTKPGSFTSPDVSLAVVKLCADAGAREIVTLLDPRGGYWQRSAHAAACAAAIDRVQSTRGGFVDVDLPKGVALKKAEMRQALFECDVFINLPIAKHHAGTGFSGCLKNMMGACSGSTNRFFHNGSGASDEYGDVAFLSQCIADVNLARRPDLCVCDATEYLVTNGPAGPGELGHAQAVVAGADPVAVDAYAAQTYLKLRPERVAMIRQAQAHGLGRIDWQALQVRTAG